MGWFDEQIRQRKASDQELFEDSILRMAATVLGKQGIGALDDRIVTKAAIDEILKYYHYKSQEIPDSITVFLDTTDQDSTVRAPSADPTRISNEEEFQSAVSDLSDSLTTVLYRLMLRISLSGD